MYIYTYIHVHTIQPLGWCQGNEELAAISVGTTAKEAAMHHTENNGHGLYQTV